jgi:hypothetical protein
MYLMVNSDCKACPAVSNARPAFTKKCLLLPPTPPIHKLAEPLQHATSCCTMLHHAAVAGVRPGSETSQYTVGLVTIQKLQIF